MAISDLRKDDVILFFTVEKRDVERFGVVTNVSQDTLYVTELVLHKARRDGEDYLESTSLEDQRIAISSFRRVETWQDVHGIYGLIKLFAKEAGFTAMPLESIEEWIKSGRKGAQDWFVRAVKEMNYTRRMEGLDLPMVRTLLLLLDDEYKMELLTARQDGIRVLSADRREELAATLHSHDLVHGTMRDWIQDQHVNELLLRKFFGPGKVSVVRNALLVANSEVEAYACAMWLRGRSRRQYRFVRSIAFGREELPSMVRQAAISALCHQDLVACAFAALRRGDGSVYAAIARIKDVPGLLALLKEAYEMHRAKCQPSGLNEPFSPGLRLYQRLIELNVANRVTSKEILVTLLDSCRRYKTTGVDIWGDLERRCGGENVSVTM